jgi:hypothetical protein
VSRFYNIASVVYDCLLTTLGIMPSSCGHASCSCNDLSLWNRPPTQLRMHAPLRSGRRQYQSAVDKMVMGQLNASRGTMS